MPSRNRITFTIEGPIENEGHLDLAVFSKKVEALSRFVKVNVEEYASEHGIPKNQIAVRVTDLSHSSPARIICEAGSHQALFRRAAFLMESVMEETTENISYRSIKSLKILASDESKKIRRMTFGIESGDQEHRNFSFDKKFVRKVDNAIKTEDVIHSAIEGKLEQINIHNGRNRFTIYRSILGDQVACKFRPDHLEKAKVAIGRYVSVSGKCKYRPGAPSPHAIDVHEMKILENSDDLPSFRDLRGIAPNLTKGKTPEEFVREIRDEWDSSG